MDILFILSSNHDFMQDTSTDRLIREADNHFDTVSCKPINTVSLQNGVVLIDGKSIEEYDIVSIRAKQNMFTNQQLRILSQSNVFFDTDPSTIIQYSSKIHSIQYTNTPKSIVTNSVVDVRNFMNESECDKFIVKPTDGFRGNKIYEIESDDGFLELRLMVYDDYFVVQEKLDVESNGDKRVLVVNGKIIGCGLRYPPDGDFIANHHNGGQYMDTFVTEREYYIAKAVADDLKGRDVYIAGLDFIQEYLTEINIGSVGSINSIDRLVEYNVPGMVLSELKRVVNE